MDKLVEFGYTVSKDYEKLWGLIHSGKRMFGLVNYKGNSGNVMRDVVGIEYLDKYDSYIIGSRGISHVGVIDTKNDFIENCKEINLTFIDPEPVNAIYYSDGSAVKEGDKIDPEIIDCMYANTYTAIIIFDRGSYCAYIKSTGNKFEAHLILLRECMTIEWDKNRMTNVVKVVE